MMSTNGMQKLIISIFLLLFCGSSFSDELPLSLRSARVWDNSTGLPHNTAQSISQTKDGYLWVATWEGLARFNGRDWKVFDRNEIPGLSDNGIKVLLAASNGDLWVGSARDGLFKYSKGAWVAIPYGAEIGQGQVQSLYEDHRKQIWMLTGDKAIFLITADGKIIRKKLDLPDPGARLLDFSENSKDELFLSSSLGLFKLNAENSFVLQTPVNSSQPAVLAMARDLDGHLILAMATGLYKESVDGFVLIPGTEKITENVTIEDMLLESNDRIILGTQGDGLFCFCSGKLEQFSTKNGLVNNRVASLFLDRENSLWIGTNLGVTRLHRGNITKFTKSNGLSDDYVRAVVNDAKTGVTWVATSNGLNRIENNIVSHFGQEQGLPSNSIYSLLLKNGNELWVGTDKQGIGVLRNNHFEMIDEGEGLSVLQVRALVSDGNRVWAGLSGRTGGGVAVIESGRVKEFFAKSLTIRTLFLDSKSRLWIGATTGIYIYQHDQLQRLQQPGLNLQYAFGFYEDERGVVWVAADNGLYRIADGKAVMIGLSRGLPSVPLLGVIGSDQDIWMCSNQGVIKLKRSELDAVAAGKKSMLGIHDSNPVTAVFSRLQCNGGGNPIMGFKPPYLMFSTSSGLAMVSTTQSELSDNLNDVFLEKFLVDGQSVALKENSRLAPESKRIEFTYAAPTFIAPEQVLFNVRLNGFEDDWRPATRNNEVTYTNLPPGKYELWVETSNGVMKKRGKILKFPFSIEAHFWQMPVFWWLMALVAIFGVFCIIRYNIKKGLERQAELEHLVGVRTNEIKDYSNKLEIISKERENLLQVLQSQTEGLAKLASEDALTGLSNRRNFEEVAGGLFTSARQEDRSLSLAVLDIDNLKPINDTYGHLIGDKIIRAVAEKLQHATRGRDVVARVGGDEFVMVFPGMSADSAVEVCERLCREVAALDFSSLNVDLKVTISVGVSDLPHAPTLDKLVADADRYLYQAKKLGRNRVAGQATH
jgi:diguanylate cyclase (GGDEF)-like protein